MLKHVSYRSSSTSLSRNFDPSKAPLSPDQIRGYDCPLDSPYGQYPPRNHPDNVSLSSNFSYASLNRHYSVGSSTLSLNDPTAVPVKVHLRRLRPDMEYKTIPLSLQTTCKELIHILLKKFRLRHRDPNLFYVLMEIGVRDPSDGAPVTRQLVLEDTARPAELQQCRPKGEANFSIGVKRGGLIRVHDSILMPGSQYKSLMVSYNTTSEEVVQLLLNCYNSTENPNHYCLHEVCRSTLIDRKVKPDQCPVRLQAAWPKETKQFWSLVLRRNILYTINMKSKFRWRRSLDQSSTDTEPELDDHDTSRASIMSFSSTISNMSVLSSSSGVSSNISSDLSSFDSPIVHEIGSSFKLEAPLQASTPNRSNSSLVVTTYDLKDRCAPKPVPRTLFPLTLPTKSPSSVTLTSSDCEDSGIVVDDNNGDITPTESIKSYFKSPVKESVSPIYSILSKDFSNLLIGDLHKQDWFRYVSTLPKKYSETRSRLLDDWKLSKSRTLCPSQRSFRNNESKKDSEKVVEIFPKSQEPSVPNVILHKVTPVNATNNDSSTSKYKNEEENKSDEKVLANISLEQKISSQNSDNEKLTSPDSSNVNSVTMPTPKILQNSKPTNEDSLLVAKPVISASQASKPNLKFANIRSLSKSTSNLNIIPSNESKSKSTINLLDTSFVEEQSPEIPPKSEVQTKASEKSMPFELNLPLCACQRCFYI